MNKTQSAAYAFRRMDETAAKDEWINRLHPLVKLALTFVYIALVVSFPRLDIIGLSGMAAYPLAVFLLSGLSFRESLKNLRFALPFVCVMGLTNALFDRSVIMLGSTAISAGALSAVSLILKGIFTVFACYLLIASTNIEKLCCALRLIHIPAILVAQFMMMCRYITLLLEEVNRITQAYALRAPRQKGIHFRVWGCLVGQLLLRCMDRAEVIGESMALRGFRGEYTLMGNQRCFRCQDVLYLFVWLVILLILRFVPVVWMLGAWMGGWFA